MYTDTRRTDYLSKQSNGPYPMTADAQLQHDLHLRLAYFVVEVVHRHDMTLIVHRHAVRHRGQGMWAHPMYTLSMLTFEHSAAFFLLSGECGAATRGSILLTSNRYSST